MSLHISAPSISSEYETLTLAFDRSVAVVHLNRPDQANAMNEPMWRELAHCFTSLDANSAVRAVVLAGSGKHFCSGIDLNMLSALHSRSPEPARAAEQLRQKIRELQGNLSTIANCRKPVLAAVHGACLGGGVDIISCCDMRYADSSARFAIREIDVGLVADVGSLQRLPYVIGDAHVRELAYTGRELAAEEARQIGLVSRVYSSVNQMMEQVMAVAQLIATKSPLAIRGIKQTMEYGRSHSVEDSLDYVATWNSSMLSFADIESAIAAAKSGTIARFDD